MPTITDYEFEKIARKAELYDSNEQIKRWVVRGLIAAGLLLLLIIGGCAYGKPQYNRYKAETQKKVLIAEARARADAAKYEAERSVEIANATAEADRKRAAGIADSNRIIADSITAEYNQWLYIQNLGELAVKTGATVIYVPTEGGIPVTEAGRIATTTTAP